jgi:hypothetical protein
MKKKKTNFYQRIKKIKNKKIKTKIEIANKKKTNVHLLGRR